MVFLEWIDKFNESGCTSFRLTPEEIKEFYRKHFKARCPDCGDVMHSKINPITNDIIWECKKCHKEWL